MRNWLRLLLCTLVSAADPLGGPCDWRGMLLCVAWPCYCGGPILCMHPSLLKTLLLLSCLVFLLIRLSNIVFRRSRGLRLGQISNGFFGFHPVPPPTAEQTAAFKEKLRESLQKTPTQGNHRVHRVTSVATNLHKAKE